MEDSVVSSKKSRVVFRNSIAGLVGLVFALVVTLAALRVQDFLPGGFLDIVLFVCPVPIACGLFVGFVSPQKAVAWAPLWSAIVAVLLFMLIAGNVREAGAALSAGRVLSVLAGALVAALAGWAGRWGGRRSHVGKLLTALIVICCIMAGVGSLAMRDQVMVYQRDMQPLVLSDVDRDYIALPAAMEWKSERVIAEGHYRLTSTLHGHCIRVLAEPNTPDPICVEYTLNGGRADLRTTEAARTYLRRLGVRDTLLHNLSQCRGASGNWSSVLQATRLSISKDGRMLMTGLPLRNVSRESAP